MKSVALKMPATSEILSLVEELITDGTKLARTTSADGQWVNADGARAFKARLKLLLYMCGPMLAPWTDELTSPRWFQRPSEVLGAVAALVTFQRAVIEGKLRRFRDLVFAEAFADLFEQADYLLSEGYALAAAVLFRAVLEERLRLMCEAESCAPTRPRPTIEDFNQALRIAGKYDKAMMLHITALAAIGNNAAHNKPEFTPADVPRLRDGVRDFLARFSS